MIIDCVSDLHGHYPDLPIKGELLILAGDYTASGKLKEWREFFTWLKDLNYEKKILIAGNHDNVLFNRLFRGKQEFERINKLVESLNIDVDFDYLCDSGTEYNGLKIWGSPWSLWFSGINPHCTYFSSNEDQLMDNFYEIPTDTDILITHSPAHGILDECISGNVGSKALYNWLKYVGRPRVHVFGHIHEGYGQTEVFPTYNDKMMISVNASHMDENYNPVNKPIRIEI